MDVWKGPKKGYLHFVEAEVLTGNSTLGQRDFILPPLVGKDSMKMYDSLSGPEISVIFNGHQALPKYIITCEVWKVISVSLVVLLWCKHKFKNLPLDCNYYQKAIADCIPHWNNMSAEKSNVSDICFSYSWTLDGCSLIKNFVITTYYIFFFLIIQSHHICSQYNSNILH